VTQLICIISTVHSVNTSLQLGTHSDICDVFMLVVAKCWCLVQCIYLSYSGYGICNEYNIRNKCVKVQLFTDTRTSHC